MTFNAPRHSLPHQNIAVAVILVYTLALVALTLYRTIDGFILVILTASAIAWGMLGIAAWVKRRSRP